MKTSIISFWQRKFIWDFVVALMVLTLPLCVYLHLYFDKEISYFMFLDFYYQHDYVNNRVIIWCVLVKVIPATLFTIWFFNSIERWRYLILLYNVIYITTLIQMFNHHSYVEEYFYVLAVLANLIFLSTVLFLDSCFFKNLGKIYIISPIPTFLALRKYGYTGYFALGKNSIRRYKFDVPEFKDLRGLTYFKESIDKVLIYLRKNTSFGETNSKFGFVVLISLVCSVFFYYSYRFFSDGELIYGFGSRAKNSYGFNDLRTLLWFVRNKICLITPCILWFITCKHWWKYTIFSPIVLSVFQLWEVFQIESTVADETDILRPLPIILIVVVILLLVSRLINYQTKLLDLNDKITSEIETLIDTHQDSKNLQDKKNRLIALKQSKKSGDSDENLETLLALQEDIRTALETKP